MINVKVRLGLVERLSLNSCYQELVSFYYIRFPYDKKFENSISLQCSLKTFYIIQLLTIESLNMM